MFCLWEKFSQRVCHIQIRMYFANFYVNNALHEANLANCSHFQYVSRLRLRVIWISVKTCIEVTLYDEPFVTSIIEKHILIPLWIILTAVQWSTPRSLLYSLAKLNVGYTIDLVHSMAYFNLWLRHRELLSFSFYLLACVAKVWNWVRLKARPRQKIEREWKSFPMPQPYVLQSMPCCVPDLLYTIHCFWQGSTIVI